MSLVNSISERHLLNTHLVRNLQMTTEMVMFSSVWGHNITQEAPKGLRARHSSSDQAYYHPTCNAKYNHNTAKCAFSSGTASATSPQICNVVHTYPNYVMCISDHKVTV